MKLIDKAAVVAKIEKRLEFVEKRLKRNNSYTEEGNIAWERDKALYDAYNSLLFFLNTLEVKETDLEKEISEYFVEHSDEFFSDKYKLFAQHFFELGMQQSKNDNNNEEKK